MIHGLEYFSALLLQGAGANLEGVSLELMLLDWDRVTKNEVWI